MSAMDIFTREEAFSVVKNKFQVTNPEERMTTDKRALLDEIIIAFQEQIPFQNLTLMSIDPPQRRGPTMEEIKSDFLANVGGLCFSMNICGYFLFKALGFDVTMAHGTCTTTVRFTNNHVTIYVHNVEKPGDKFLVELALGLPTFQAVSLDFETESPIYVSSYLEYKYVKHDGKILRMQRKGDGLANRNRVQNPELDFWIGDFRRFCEIEVESSTNLPEFQKCSDEIFLNPKASPFHTSFRFILYKDKKATIVFNGKTMMQNDKDELDSKEIDGGDEGIVMAVKKLSPNFPEDVIRRSLHNWRQITAAKS